MLETITIAGGITTFALAAYLWFLPSCWWAMFCQQHRWVFDAGTGTTDVPVTATPATGAIARLQPIAVENGQRQRYSLLEAIDRARGPGYQPLAGCADASDLERYAQQIVDQSWSERVWLTGYIDQARFDALCSALEQHRPMSGSDVKLVVVRGLPSRTIRNAR